MITTQHLLLLCGITPLVRGAIHNLFVGSLVAPASIYALEFDDETYDFKVVKNNTADATHAWITFDVSRPKFAAPLPLSNPPQHAKKNIYGSSVHASRVSSYTVLNATTLSLTNSIPASGACSNTSSAFIAAMPTEPYYAISASWPGPNSCGMSFSVDANGTLTDALNSWSYTNASAVHGLALAPPSSNGQQLVYSADTDGDIIWTHKLNLTTGAATEVFRFQMPFEGMHPRHVAVHPNGKYLYAVMEADNSLTQYTLSPSTGAPETETLRYMLIPIDGDTSLFWSSEVMLSPSARYLWASTRVMNSTALGAVEGNGGNTTLTGYMTAFLLDDDGAVARRMFRVATTSPATARSRGIQARMTNQVSPAFWSDEFVAVTDYPEGFVEVWKMEGRSEGRDGLVEYAGARAVARVDVADGGCCANVIWYS
jgi:carboxy-cis,cis-muconate cyclase